MKKIGVVLSGCGVMDGSEIHEATLTLLFLDREGVETVIMAPNVNQLHVVNHLTNEETGETRNVLEESARIARGNIRDIKDVRASDIDGLVFPGGYGAAKNLFDYAVKGVNCSVNPEVERLIKEMHSAKKPMGFICIAPVLAARVLGEYSPKLTIGSDRQTAADVEKLGGKHVEKSVDDIVYDEKNNVVSTPAYMLGPSIAHVAKGIEKLVNKVVSLA